MGRVVRTSGTLVRVGPTRNPRRRICLEPLEERVLPSVATYSSTNVPKTLPDETTITSTLTVPDHVTIGDLNLTLTLNHTYDSDVDAFLIAPNGTTTIEL